ncbi:MAG: putative toxin-antitoxin system toxin component, PIN family [Pseudomonadota bacterium]
MSLRVVCDTNVVVSALIFSSGQLSWLRRAWQEGLVTPVASPSTVAELVRVFEYPKFRLTQEEREELLADYLPYAEIVRDHRSAPGWLRCRDPGDQMFLDLAYASEADALITGDASLVELAAKAPFAILTPAQLFERVEGP